MKRLSTVMPRTDGYAVAGENFADIVRMHTVYRESDDAAVLLGIFRPENMYAGDFPDALHGAAGQCRFLPMHFLKTDALYIVNRRMKPDGIGGIDRTCFKLLRQLRKTALSRVTDSIISPPVRNGGISFSSSSRP